MLSAPISSTNPAPAQSRYRTRRTVPVSASWSGVTAVYMRSSVKRNCGNRANMRAFNASTCARTCSIVAPGPSRPM